MATHEVTIYAVFDDEEGDMDLFLSQVDLALSEVPGLSAPVILVKDGVGSEVPD